jgi:hypothetical protein
MVAPHARRHRSTVVGTEAIAVPHHMLRATVHTRLQVARPGRSLGCSFCLRVRAALRKGYQQNLNLIYLGLSGASAFVGFHFCCYLRPNRCDKGREPSG